MKIFISWSGVRSKTVASALHGWIPLILQSATPWMSQHDIVAGERWSVQIGDALANALFGVICVTPENVREPWLLFEAGAIAKTFSSSSVVPLLIGMDITDLAGPLAQFQAKKLERSGVAELVSAINASCASPLPEGQLSTLFGVLWPELDRQVSNLPMTPGTPMYTPRPQGQVLEDVSWI